MMKNDCALNSLYTLKKDPKRIPDGLDEVRERKRD